MSPIRALGIATAVALAPQIARAADMLPPPPMVEAPLRGAILSDPDMSGWYIRGDVGAGIESVSTSTKFTAVGVTVPDNRFDAQSIGSSAFVRLGVGYQFNNWFRADITGEIRSSAAYHAVESYNAGLFLPIPTSDRGYDNYSSSIQSSVFLANGYFDLGTWYGLTPYIGAGVGFAAHNVSGLNDIGGTQPIGQTAGGVAIYGSGGYGFAPSKVSIAPAFALMTGLSWDVNKRLKLEIGYRYLNMGSATAGVITCQPNIPSTNCPFERQSYKLSSQDVHIGMRWMLSEASTSASYSASATLPSANYAAGGYGSGQVVTSGQVVQGGGYGAAGGAYVASGSVSTSRPRY